MLGLETVGGRIYEHLASNVRLSKNELRWTNSRGEKRQIALAFLISWSVIDV